MTGQPQDNRELWEQRYQAGKVRINYPYDEVVSFMLGRYPEDRRNQTTVLDFGCGAGNHLWFLLENGFDAFGVDSSVTAVTLARETAARAVIKFDDNKVKVTSGDDLPFGDGMFDVVIDRSSLGQNRSEDIPALVAEIHRVLKPGGTYLGINFSDHYPDLHRARNCGSGDFSDFAIGNLKEIGVRHFFSVSEIFDLFTGFAIEDVRVLSSLSLFDKRSNQQLVVIANK